LLGWLASPSELNGQAEGDARAVDLLLVEVAAQQVVIGENQAKIDEKLAAVGEELRLARIYVGRGGGKTR
jgi:hypothetical protein